MQRSAVIPRLSVILAGLMLPAVALAQMKPACAAGKTGKPAAITDREAWDLARQRARAWQADAVPSNSPRRLPGRSTRRESRRTGA